MPDKVLIVDDDPNVLKAYERRLRRRFEVETALCSEEGVTAVSFLGPFSVIVSDMSMPRENGAEFLARILEVAPDSTRIMLTGNADQKTAAAAINQGRVFRFLNKPCEAETLEAAIADGIAEYRRTTAERELLEKTLLGSIEMLSRVLEVANPTAFGRASRLRDIVAEIAADAGVNDAWEYEAAALLSQVGCVGVPDTIVQKAADGEELSDREQAALNSQAELAGELIGAIPRLEQVAEIVRRQDEEPPTPSDPEEQSPVDRGIALLRLAKDYDALVHDDGVERAAALAALRGDADGYDSRWLEALAKSVATHDARRLALATVEQLAEGMTLAEHVETGDGALLVARGQKVTPSMHKRLMNYTATHEVRQPLRVLATADQIEQLELVEPTAEPAGA